MDAKKVKVFKDKEPDKGQQHRSDMSALNDHLFRSLERLSSLDINDENMEREIERSEQIAKTAKTIIEQGQLALQYQKHMDDMGYGQIVETPLIGMADSGLVEENDNLRKKVKRYESY